jgi:hypothetical protein
VALKWPNKDPDEVLDYQIDWSRRLYSDTIVTSTWPTTLPAGLTLGVMTNTLRTTTVWLSGGVNGTTYTLTNRITTVGGAPWISRSPSSFSRSRGDRETMAAGTYDILCDQGATFRLSMVWKDATLTPIDLTGYAAALQVRTEAAEPGIIIELTTVGGGVGLGGSAGTISIFIDAGTSAGLDPANALYDLLMTAPSGDKTRLLQGKFTIRAAITR